MHVTPTFLTLFDTARIRDVTHPGRQSLISHRHSRVLRLRASEGAAIIHRDDGKEVGVPRYSIRTHIWARRAVRDATSASSGEIY